jgi:Cytochrome c554 and c-prime
MSSIRLLLAALGVAAAAVSAAGQSTAPGQYIGVAQCANSGCHGSTLPLKETRVLQNEYYTWLDADRHAKAYAVLFNNLSARIAKNMRLKKRAYEEKLCLDCHSTNLPASQVAGRIDPEDGVQCEACHGPAGGWRAEHTQAGWTHQQSVERGMIDLRALPVRAHTCHRCHLGNAEKEVDHELIASGHPVLQFELDNYSASMPPHWSMNVTHGARAWATGQAMSFRDSLTNLARHARGEKWPEFADMSCINCHHSLENSMWRQERGWPGRAGLPAWSPQRWGVLRLLVGRAAPSTRAQLDDLVATLGSRVARMNDRDGIATSALEAKRIIETALPKIDALPWRDEDVRAMMRTLAADESFLLAADVHSAEQTTLALHSLASALIRSNPRLLRSPMMTAIDALDAEIANRERYEPSRFVEKLRAVRGAL